jgi:hypothetical protein
MVINLQQRGSCVPVPGDDRLLPLIELPYVTGRRIVTAEACANADHDSMIAKGRILGCYCKLEDVRNGSKHMKR